MDNLRIVTGMVTATGQGIGEGFYVEPTPGGRRVVLTDDNYNHVFVTASANGYLGQTHVVTYFQEGRDIVFVTRAYNDDFHGFTDVNCNFSFALFLTD